MINDKYRGVYPEIERALAHIKQTYTLRECSPFLSQHLEAALFSQPDDIIFLVTGRIQKSQAQIPIQDFSVTHIKPPVDPFISDIKLPGEIKVRVL